MSKQASEGGDDQGRPAAAGTSFEDTLDVLEERRRVAEAGFLDRLREIEAQIRVFSERVDEAAEMTRARLAAHQAVLRGLGEQLSALRVELAAASPPRPAWPQGQGFFRRNLNRLWYRMLR
ncbi:MAG: hypothetical protein ACE5HV_06950, partial [Acidobacteriota bacterium]